MVFEDMIQSRVAPSNITFSILVKLYFEAGQIAEAFRVVDEMGNRYRCVPSRIVYTVLLRCCGQQGGPALARGAAILSELASKRNSKLPDQGMISAVITGCIQHLEFDLACRVVREFASGVSGKRVNTGLVQIDSLRSLMEALGAHDEPRGQELLEFLKRKSLPTSHTAQLQTCLADGRRQGPSQLQMAGVANNGGASMATAAHGTADPYAQQWQNTAYTSTDYYQQYNVGYQQQQFGQMGQNLMGQMGYYGGYQAQPQMPMYQSMQVAVQQVPMMPTMPAMATMPGSMPVPVMGAEMLAAPAAVEQAPLQLPAALPTGLPLSAPPTADVAPAPAQTIAAPAAPPRTEKKAPRRRADKENNDKENAMPAQPRTKGELGSGKHGGLVDAAGLRQAI